MLTTCGNKRLDLKPHTVKMPKAADVPTSRKRPGLSQPEFAGFMGVSLAFKEKRSLADLVREALDEYIRGRTKTRKVARA